MGDGLGAVVADGNVLLAAALAVLAGAVSFASPCVLPLVPGYLGFIAGAVAPREAAPRESPVAPRESALGSAEGSAASHPDGRTATGSTTTTRRPRTDAAHPDTVGRGRLLAGVLLFIAGFTLVFMALNILGGAFGMFLLEYEGVITRILGVVVIAMGFVFIGLFGIAQRTFRPQLRGNAGLIGAPLLGIALGLGWAPCIGPTLAAILSVSWNLGDPGRGAVLGLAYSAGLGIPFVLLALGLGWATKSVAFVRRHIRTFNVVGGVLLVALGILMVSGVWSHIMSQLQGVMANVPLPL